MENTKKYMNFIICGLIVLAFALVCVSCDTDECFEKSNYKSSQIHKAAPGTNPNIEIDC